MQVFLDLTPLATISSLRGIGRYVRGLSQGLAMLGEHERLGIEVIGLAADHELRRLQPVSDLLAQCEQPARPPVRGAGRRRDWLLSRAAPRLVGRKGLLHLSEPKGYPWPRWVPVTATSHDLISLTLPDLYQPPIPYWSRYLEAKFRLRYSRYRGVIAVSQATRRDLGQLLGIPDSRMHVVEHGVDHERFKPTSEPEDTRTVAELVGDPDQPFVLYLGAGDARKDIHCLVEAFARSRARGHAKLVLAGRYEAWRVEQLRALIDRLGLRDRVVCTGYLEEAAVPALYRQARVHAFVSRYEGFGLPVLEAMACGTPTITSPGSSLDEVAGDAALIAACGDPDALQHQVDRLFFDDALRADLRARGLARAATFTWQRCAQQTLSFFASAG